MDIILKWFPKNHAYVAISGDFPGMIWHFDYIGEFAIRVDTNKAKNEARKPTPLEMLGIRKRYKE